MERSPLISWVFHLRIVSLLLLLGGLDYLFIRSAWHSVTSRGLSVEIVFGLEYAIMLLNAINTFLRYILHSIDLQSEDPWENKTIYMRFIDIVLGFFKLIIYLSYMSFMLYVLFIPLHIARRVYITAKNFQKSIADVVSSHRAIRNLNTLYPDATTEELDSANNVCIICREEMVSRCKKLPCNHIFHMSCLRSWFQRQQTCPTCRMDVLSESVLSRLNRPQARRQQQNNQQGEGQAQPNAGGLPPNVMFPMMWPGMVPPPLQQPAQHNQPEPAQHNQQGNEPDSTGNAQAPPTEPEGGVAPPSTENQSTANSQTNAGTSNMGQGSNPPPFPPFMMPPPFMGPPFGPVPPFGGMPSGEALRGLSDEQVRALEGMERANVEARVELLRGVQRLLDTAVTQLNQYSAVMATLGPSAGPGFPGYPQPPGVNAPPTSTGPTLYTPQPAQAATPRQPPAQSQSTFSGSTSKLSELKPTFSFTGSTLSSDSDEDEGLTIGPLDNGSSNEGPEPESSEAVKSKVEELGTPEGSPINKDVEDIRHRRLQRFNSVPQTGSLIETGEEGSASKSSTQGETENS